MHDIGIQFLRKVSPIILFSVSQVICAGEIYKCKVESAQGLKDNGSIASDKFSQLHIGKFFAVDKATGKMEGVLANHNSHGQPKIVDSGSETQSFKVVTVYDPTLSVDYLYVENFNENPKKPFIFLKWKNLFGGTCEIVNTAD